MAWSGNSSRATSTADSNRRSGATARQISRRVAGAYGIPSKSIGTEDRAEAALSWLLAGPGPALLEVMVPAETNVYPKLAFGRPITEMEPFAKPVGMEST